MARVEHRTGQPMDIFWPRVSGMTNGWKKRKPEAAFGVAAAALNSVAFTGIAVHLPFDFCICLAGLSAAQRGSGQANSKLFAVELVCSGLIDPVGEDRAGTASKLSGVILNSGFQVAAFIEIVPGGLLQIGVTVHYGQVKFLPKFCGIRTFSTLNWADVGLLQTDDPILAGVGVVVVHLLLLAVHG